MLGVKSFDTAQAMLVGIELRHMLGVGKDSSQKLTDLGMREKFEQF